ncbi:hypothetical protein V5799_033055 [Amblyomma americanum]|uniref:Uncharacterized protein n=1 Tax=Amblyomma americanum TaxID=6943 RepID=A0AAQ4DPE9_AMBAM
MRIPKGFDKIILRPQGGLERLMKYGGAFLADGISKMAGNEDGGAGDVITFNTKHQSILVTTGDASRRNKYASLTELIVGDVKTTWAWQHGRDDIASSYAVACAATGPGLLFLRSRQPDYRRRTCARCLPAGRCGWTVAIPP